MLKKILAFSMLAALLVASVAQASEKDIPVPNTVTMLDLGAKSCIPCKMMAPILERLGVFYEGKAAIRFIDIRENSEAATQYGVRAIPTQIFFDKQGKERERHTGFLDEDIIKEKINALLAE